MLKGIAAHALLVGSGPELERNRQLAKDSSVLAGRVTFVGASDEVPDILNTMDVFALHFDFRGHVEHVAGGDGHWTAGNSHKRWRKSRSGCRWRFGLAFSAS